MTKRNIAIVRELMLAATLAAGVGTLWCLFVVWVGAAIQSVWEGGQETWPPREELVVKSNGTPLIRSTPFHNLSLLSFRDLSGRPEDDPGPDGVRPGLTMAGELPDVDSFWSDGGWEQRLKVFINEREPAIDWFFVHDGKARRVGILRRLRTRESSPGRLHRPRRFPF